MLFSEKYRMVLREVDDLIFGQTFRHIALAVDADAFDFPATFGNVWERLSHGVLADIEPVDELAKVIWGHAAVVIPCIANSCYQQYRTPEGVQRQVLFLGSWFMLEVKLIY